MVGCGVAKETANPFGGCHRVSVALGGMCTHMGAGNAAGKVLCAHEGVSRISSAFLRFLGARGAVPCSPGAWLWGCVRHVACQHCYNSRGKTGRGFVSSEHVQMPNLFIPLTLPFASFRGICIETQRMERGKRGDGDRKRASPGSARRGDKHLCVAGDSSWIHPVVLASERSPQENKCLVFQDPPQLKIFLETSFLWETKPRCTAGLCRWCLYGWGSLPWGLRFQLQGEPNLRKAQNI